MKEALRNKKAQVWVETVVYTLIAFALIAAVLGFAKPKIEELQDKAIIEQTLQMMEDLNSQIEAVKEVPGNKRLLKINLKKGDLLIDGIDDEITFTIKSRYIYSEPEAGEINVGSVVVSTEKSGKYGIVSMKIDYSENCDLTFQEGDLEKLIGASSVPHNLFVENKGKLPLEKINIDFTLG